MEGRQYMRMRRLMTLVWKITSRSAQKWDQMRSALDDRQIGVGWVLWAISRWAYRRSDRHSGVVFPTVKRDLD